MIAFRAGGISFLRLVAPIIACGFIVSVLTIVFNESIVPRSFHSSEKLFRSIKHTDKPTIRQNVNFTEYDQGGLPLRIINVQEIDKGFLKQVTVAEYDEGELVRVIRAKSGQFLASGGWEFYDGIMHFFPKNRKRDVTVASFKKEFINIPITAVDLDNREKRIEELNAFQLKARIDHKKVTGQNYQDDLVKFHMKFSVPFACLIFSILGSVVGIRPHRSSSALGLGISIVIILIYYILIGISVGVAHIIPAIIAAWLPNLVVGSIGIILLNRIARQ